MTTKITGKDGRRIDTLCRRINKIDDERHALCVAMEAEQDEKKKKKMLLKEYKLEAKRREASREVNEIMYKYE